ncbi:MAG: hypothetical protein K6A23_15725 [Butyrivibrio sp.]|nr:hypothetical protein [Butyrivibrio sp.]
MRQLFFRKLIDILQVKTPGLFKNIELQILANATALSFNMPSVQIWYKPYKQALSQYRKYTVKCMEKGDINPERIYDTAFKTGSIVRKVTGFANKEDLEKLVFYLYKNIKITMSGDLPGEITVSRCYFSRAYSPSQCRLMSIMDSGIVAGIWGGGSLKFTRRITEGCKNCKACFKNQGQRD